MAPSGKSWTPARNAAYAPSFISTPAWIIETAVGAATWPSGLQLWNGKTPASTPKPRKIKGNHSRAKYLMHTGYAPNPTVTHPALGALVSHEIGREGFDLPNFVQVNGGNGESGGEPDEDPRHRSLLCLTSGPF